MNKAIYFSIISGLCMAPVAFADGPHGPHGPHGMPPEARAERFKEIDTNGDGAIDRTEHAKHGDDRFAAMDVDGDGKVTRDEARDAFRAEMRERAMAHFDRVDDDHDGQVSREEWGKHLEQMESRFEGKGPGNGKGRGRGMGMGKGEGPGWGAKDGRGRGHHGMGRGGHFFGRLDTNGDGAVDAAEHRAGTDRRFEAADANGDGRLSQDEFMAPRRVARDARKGSGKGKGKGKGKAPSGHGMPRR